MAKKTNAKKAPYIIWAPPYNPRSGGVRALYKLQQLLVEHGYEAQIATAGEAPDDAIVIYPEIVTGNPLNGKTVVRYVLNTPGLLGGDKEYSPTEIIFTHSKRFYNANILTIPTIEDFFHNYGLPRSGGYFWVGKGIHVPRIPETKGMTEITYSWPAERKELAMLLNKAEVLYTYDDCTALISEARACGCRVVVVTGEIKADLFEELKPFDKQLKDFIQITQAECSMRTNVANKNGITGSAVSVAGETGPYRAPITPPAQPMPTASPKLPNLVSIVILAFNELRYTKECIDSITRHTPQPYEIIIVDNGSTDGTAKWLKELAQDNICKVINNSKNLGFTKGCNQGINASQGEYVLLLNNDVVVAEGWLSGLLESLHLAPDAGIVGPMTNNISGLQQFVSEKYQSVEYLDEFAAQFRDKHRHLRIPTKTLVGFCMLFRRALTEKIGMLDESFGTGNFEDAEFCIRAVLAGHKNYIAGDVFIHHYGGRSFLGNKIGRGKTTSGNRWFLEKKLTLNYRSEAGKKIAVLNAIETADYFYQKGNIDQAVDALIGCLEVSRNAKEIYHEIARISIETKRFSEAWESIETMPEAAKNDLKSLEYAGYAKEGLGLDHEADVYAERMFTKNQNYPAGLNLKGGLAYKKGEKEKAAEYFKKAIDADPGYGEAHTNLGVLYWSIDKKDEALAYLRKGFVLSPTVPDTSSLYYSAVSSLATHRDAEVDFREACRFYPNNRNLAFIYIDTLIQQEKFDLAMPKLEDALAMFGIDEGTVKAALVVREKIGPLQIEKAAKKRTLSLCMTAKNEEPHIVRQLKSVRDVLDEIVVVNTGSTDRTIDIVRAFGAKVLEFSGTEDLSQARNYALLQSAGDWILIPDTGEILSAHDVEQLKAIIRKNSSSLPADSRYHNKLYKRGNAAGSTIRL